MPPIFPASGVDAFATINGLATNVDSWSYRSRVKMHNTPSSGGGKYGETCPGKLYMTLAITGTWDKSQNLFTFGIRPRQLCNIVFTIVPGQSMGTVGYVYCAEFNVLGEMDGVVSFEAVFQGNFLWNDFSGGAA